MLFIRSALFLICINLLASTELQAEFCKNIFPRWAVQKPEKSEFLSYLDTQSKASTNTNSLEYKLAIVYSSSKKSSEERESPELWFDQLVARKNSKKLFSKLRAIELDSGISAYNLNQLSKMLSKRDRMPLKLFGFTGEAFAKVSAEEAMDSHIFQKNFLDQVNLLRKSYWEYLKQGYQGLKKVSISTGLLAANLASSYFFYVPVWIPSTNGFLHSRFSPDTLAKYEASSIEEVWPELKSKHPIAYYSSKLSRLPNEGINHIFMGLFAYSLGNLGYNYVESTYFPELSLEEKEILIITEEIYPGFPKSLFLAKSRTEKEIDSYINFQIQGLVSQEAAQEQMPYLFNNWKVRFAEENFVEPEIDKYPEQNLNWLEFVQKSLRLQFSLELYKMFSIDFEEKYNRKPDLLMPEDFLLWKKFIAHLNN